MDSIHDIACVILAGGRGKRMSSSDLHKVCFPIVGRPAIVRSIETYKAAGLRRFLVVVGQMADQVIATISAAHPEVTFVYQADPLGTGHAATVAADALASQADVRAALITMGDKITRPEIVRTLIERYRRSLADVVMSTLPKSPTSTAGRVVMNSDGRVLGIVEKADIDRARERKEKIHLGGHDFTAAGVEKNSDSVNASLYLFKFDRLREALGRIHANNAQGELYLTDTIGLLADDGRVETMLVEDSNDLMAYNTPDELVAIEEVIRKREAPPRVKAAGRKSLTPRVLKTAGQWRTILHGNDPKFLAELRRTYGKDEALLTERRRELKHLVQAFIQRFGKDREIILCRAPGRVNLMGRHVDHRGGYVNVMAISKEVLLAAAPRGDDLVHLEHVEPDKFATREFRIANLLRDASWSDWIDFVDSQAVKLVQSTQRGDWSHYARAPLLRLQHECRDVRMHGMDCMVTGNIPMGAGLSSSSALVVAFAEAAVALNGLNVAMRDFVDLCGEGEWFVGSRGGSADHAAIRTGKIGSVSRIGFYPFRMEGEVRLPASLRVVIAYSGSMAVKSAGAKDTFNQRVASYNVALWYLKKHWPPAGAAEHLRDLTPDKLKVPTAEIYRAIKRLPDCPTRAELRKLFPKSDQDRLEHIFCAHADIGPYDLRGVTLYGLGEILRSHDFANLLKKRDIPKIGEFFRLSHDGDRCFTTHADGSRTDFVIPTDDQELDRLAKNKINLADQPGRYACSTSNVDALVDLSNSVGGVIGAQLAGAGLGGCIMILAQARKLDQLLETLKRDFYQPRDLPFGAFVCTPVAGAGLLRA
ncbi:MAG: NTP transferase domain-containing protein [Phycisphaerae bacterium]|nr:NTP transferase domain-containing protein [Phycisphaerae bacterium]